MAKHTSLVGQLYEKRTLRIIARFMYEKLFRDRILDHRTTVIEIQEKYGEKFAYLNVNGNYVIDAKVLEEFRKITKGQAKWNRSKHYWTLDDHLIDS